MILQAKKNTNNSDYSFDYRRLINAKPNLDDAKNILSKDSTDASEFLTPNLTRSEYLNKFLVFGESNTSALLSKISSKSNFELDGRLEITQGIVTPQDNLTNKNAKALNCGLKAGDGIFILTKKELDNLQLTQQELTLIKPLYTSDELGRYHTNRLNKNYIIYTDSSYSSAQSLNNFPILKSHLDKFKDIITSDNKPYGLHRSRNPNFFVGEKIVCLRKAVIPTFAYNDFDCFVSQTFNVIKSSRINLKYLTGFFNSSLVRFWLKNKGKMQGNLYQVDKEPLLQVPIYVHSNQSVVASLVDKIIAAKQTGNDTSVYEDEIDILFCKYFDLNFDEYKFVNPDANVTRDIYDSVVL